MPMSRQNTASAQTVFVVRTKCRGLPLIRSHIKPRCRRCQYWYKSMHTGRKMPTAGCAPPYCRRRQQWPRDARVAAMLFLFAVAAAWRHICRHARYEPIRSQQFFDACRRKEKAYARKVVPPTKTRAGRHTMRAMMPPAEARRHSMPKGRAMSATRGFHHHLANIADSLEAPSRKRAAYASMHLYEQQRPREDFNKTRGCQ